VKLNIWPTAAAAAEVAAVLVAEQLAAKPRSVLGLPTGRTSLGIYEELVRLHGAGRADFSQVHTFNLDEFIGLTSNDRHSYGAFMEKHLFQRVNIPSSHVHFLNGQAEDVDEECVRYERLIDALGGIDLQLLGVGANGHIGFNEPARALRARTHRAVLKRSTRCANAGLFGGRLHAVPREALSMGMATILEASALVLVATGRTKAKAVESLFTGRVSTASPVSFLQLHPDVHVIVDRAAAAKLPRALRGLNPGPPATVEVL
jgi:glucosamine-6-phosphate deaminase